MSGGHTPDDEAIVEVYGNLDLPEGTVERPLVTFALFAYNQEKYIREAVEGALAQTYEPLEIILSDDCSSDRTFDFMREMVGQYDGPHKIKLFRNETNKGVAAHFSRVLQIAEGEYFVVAAGDDISLPERVSTLIGYWSNDRQLSFIDSGVEIIDRTGSRIGSSDQAHACKVSLHDYISTPPNGIHGATRGYRKENQKMFDSLSSECPTEDTPSLLRALMTGDGILINERLVKYRIHSSSLSSETSMRSMILAQIFDQYERDLAAAISLRAISIDRAAKIQRWIVRTRAIRMIDQAISNGELKAIGVISRLGRDGFLGFGASIRIMARYIRAITSSR